MTSSRCSFEAQDGGRSLTIIAVGKGKVRVQDRKLMQRLG
jgi:hypothetical protein